jgi:isocitrate dehydrogenase (NAD+)
MKKTKITVIPGDGIGPDIMTATLKVLDHLNCGLEYEYARAGLTALEKDGDLLPQATLDSIARNKLALKGPLTTPVGDGFRSINVTLRQKFDLYANLRPVTSFPGTRARHDNVDIVTVRENTQGMYSGEGQVLLEGGEVAEAKSVITTEGARRILAFAFDYARKNQHRKVTVVHKANILKTTSGLFLKTAREVAKQYDDILMNEMIVDNTCMQLVMHPEKFDIIVTTNLFGDIVSDLCAGLVGGLGLAPGANIGKEIAIFEAVHGSAPDIAGKNIANPTALILAAAIMLEHLDQLPKAQALRGAIRRTLSDDEHLTPDMGGDGTTSSYTEALIANLANS